PPQLARWRARTTARGLNQAAIRSRSQSDTMQLLQRRLAAQHQIEDRRAQRTEAARLRCRLHAPRGFARGDQLAQLVVDAQHLGDRAPPAVSRAAALGASLSGEYQRSRVLAGLD